MTMSQRFPLALALIVLPICVKAAPLDDQLKDLDTRLAAVAAHGADFPEALDLHRLKALSYARAFDTDCAAHAAAAEQEAKPYLTNPYAELLPSYAAHRLSLEATLAWSRGQCAENEEGLVTETQIGRDKAMEGIAVAQQRHLYDEEAFLRFQAANYARILGDGESSRALLESAIALDDRHGLTDDGLDNRHILAEWLQIEPGTLAPPPTPGKTTFHFKWVPSRVEIDSTVEITHFNGGQKTASTFDVSGAEHIEKLKAGGFRVTMDDVNIQSRSALSADDHEARLAAFLQQTMAKLPPMKVGADAAYAGIDDYDAYVAQLRRAVTQWVEQEIPATDTARRKEVDARLQTYFETNASRQRIENDFARSHALTTAIWVDSTLTTGDSLTIDLNLPMEGAPPAVIPHRIQFRVDGAIPCQASETGAPQCVEIELEATPSDDALKAIAGNLVKQGKGALHYWSTLNLRLVVNPATLEVSESDMRRAHYLQLDHSAVEAKIERSHDRTRVHHL
jgi:hypothetical protein